MNSMRPLVFFVPFCVILLKRGGGVLEAPEDVFERGVEVS